MDSKLLTALKTISEEEKRILQGDKSVQKNLYTSTDDFIVESKKMLEAGKLITVRPHTRFVHFPAHKHNYIEIIYMCSGTTLHVLNNKTAIELKQGDLLFLNQNTTQEIMPAKLEDVAVNFMVLPEFFDRIFPMIEGENMLRDFLVGTLKQKHSMVDYLHFETKDILPIQNLIENMIWSILNKETSQNSILQTTMGLLFMQLLNYSDKANLSSPDQFEQNLVFTSLKYIEENYRNGSLTELSEVTKQPTYYISKLIKKHTSHTYKQLLQTKRLTQSAYLLTHTTLTVEAIIDAVGYDNTSYFHRIFKEQFQMTPKNYSKIHRSSNSRKYSR